MTTRSTSRTLVIIALAAAFASAGVIGQEPQPKPPAPTTAKPKPPETQTAKPKPPATQTTKPKPPATQTTKPKPKPPAPTTAKPGTKPATPASGAAGPSAAVRARLRTPAKLKDVAPATFKARFDSSAGPFVIEVDRAWAPKGADRFYNLVKYGFYDGARFFRVLPGFMVQFGLNGDPSVQSAWRDANIQDDPVKESNKRGYVTYAKSGMPNSRTTQIFINYGDNARLDPDGFAPFGVVISGMEAVDKINAEYRQTPDQGRIQAQGNAYLNKAFPKLDYVTKATIEK